LSAYIFKTFWYIYVKFNSCSKNEEEKLADGSVLNYTGGNYDFGCSCKIENVRCELATPDICQITQDQEL
jgi:hypothetical protein